MKSFYFALPNGFISKGLIITILFAVICMPRLSAQLSGIKSIPGDYATVSAAVAALNTSGPGTGGVTFNVAANYTETLNSAPISLTATGTLANPIVFQKDPSTTGANPLITAYTGGTATPTSVVQDGIWRLSGSDYVTINGIDVRDNPANTTNPSTMEYGYALYKPTSSNGCQFVTIKNCTITLSNVNNASSTNPMTEGSAGILVMNASATAAIIVYGPVAGGGNSNNKFYSNTIQNCNLGISMVGATDVSPFTNADTNNDIGGKSVATGNTIINFGGAAGATNPAAGIRTQYQYGLTVSYNTINNNNGSGANHSAILRGININSATSANTTISYNTITLKGGGTSQNIFAIDNSSGSTAAGNNININNNTITNSTYTTATTGSFYGIYNTGSPATLNINNNTFTGNSTSSLSGSCIAIYNSGSAASTLNINSNNIGNNISGAFTYNAANSAPQTFINNLGPTSTAALSISNNNFQGISYAVQGSGANYFINNSAPTLSQAINNNTFTGLNVNTTGSITFISNNVIVSATGTQDVNNNSIVTSFTKPAPGGSVTLFTTSAASLAGSVINNNNNNFSNITVTGVTTLDGWVNTDPGASTKTIQNNTFSNWVAGTGLANGMNINLSGSNGKVFGNAINNISGGGIVTGIVTASGSERIYSNTINTLSSTGTTVTGILITGGTNKHVYSNKIYDLQLNNPGGNVNGILVSNSTLVSVNIYNNFIGDLRAPVASTSGDVIRGISITAFSTNSNINVYYNTIYLNAGSSGTNFSTSGIFHSVNATATTASLNLRNNIVINTSIPKGTGVTVAYRRSGTALNNYAPTSNNNLFYAGSAGVNRLIFFDGTNAEQVLTTYKTRVSTRDVQSVTEDLTTKFISTSGPSVNFLHLDASKATLAENGAVSITNFTTDYDAQIRQGNAGYAGPGTAPDIGADEINGSRALALSGTYNVGAGQAFTSLTNAGGVFAAVNSLGLGGNVVVNVTSDLAEDGSNSLYQWVEQGVGNYSMTIQPDASTARMISGDALGGLVRLNGAKRVIINGSNGTASNYLTFKNNNVAGATATAFTFINGSSYNTIRYCNIEAYANATNGVILFSTSIEAGGNSNNLISNCNINATIGSNTGNTCVYSAGTSTSGYANSNNTISNSNIFNYRDRGLDITAAGSSGWTVSGNSFYNGNVSGGIDYAANYTTQTIRILGGTGYTLINNYIGGNASLASGTAAAYSSSTGLLTYYGILLTTTGATPASNIKGNTIAGIAISAVPISNTGIGTPVFFGIETNGSGINIGGNLAGDGNMIGSNITNGSISITTATDSINRRSMIRGINCASSGGLVSGNQIGGIDIKNVGALPGPSFFLGIYINNATAPTQVNNNVIGSNGAGAALNSIRILSNSTSLATSITGISISGSVTSTLQLNGNIIQNITNFVSSATSSIIGIANAAISPAVVSITYNTVAGNTTSAATGGIFSIYSNGASASVTISSNIVSNNSSTSSTTGYLYGIYTSSSPQAITVNNNLFSGNTTAALASTGFSGVCNFATTTALTINGNTFTGNVVTNATGSFYAIYNNGAVTSALSINANNIGNSASGAVTYTTANSAGQVYINNINGSATATLSISNNNFQGITYSAVSTGTVTFILNNNPTLSQAINGNTFTNLNINTSGNITFISNSVVVSATGIQNVNNNSIAGTFAKAAGSAVTFFSSSASSLSGAVINNNNNNFSNISVTGNTTITGWVNTDAGASTKKIQNNTFSNWTGGTGSITAMSINLSGTNNATSGNSINNISSSGIIIGISTGRGNDKIYSNTINAIYSTGGFSVTGILDTAGIIKNIYRNKIYDLQATTGSVNGILVTGGTTVNIYNNLIGNLRTPAASASDPVRGISITSAVAPSTINVYYNTVYLNATSTGTNFGSTGIYHTTSSTNTTSSLNLRNNIIVNISTPGGTGYTVAYRLSSFDLTNYAATSDNNLFYAGVPALRRLIFWDGSTGDQALAAYKARVAARDASSVSEDISTKFLNTSGSSPVFLHMDSTIVSAVDNGAVNISGFTEDFDGQIRAGNPGYTGPSSLPDIGADEVFGIENVPPVITYTPLTNTTTIVNRVVTGITITDVSGVNNAPDTKPRIYYKRSSDANAWLDNTSSTNGWKYMETSNSASPFAFTIDYSLLYGGAAVTAGVIQYFIVAQDNATTANIAVNTGSFAVGPSTLALTSTAFPIAGVINSYNIAFSGIYNIGTSEVYTSLTKTDGLFAAINSAGLMGNTTFNITSDLAEDGTIALNQWTESGVGNYTFTIQAEAATLRTISGNAAGGLIRLNGADRVTVDGSNSGSGVYLSFINTNTVGTTGTAFTFINGAANNTIRYCDAQGFANASNGVLLFSTSTVAGGNSNNLIDNCTINATVAGNTSNAAIYSGGTTVNENSFNTISNNTISGYKTRGLDIGATGSSAWTISGNSFYNGNVTATVNYAASSTLHGIRVSGGSGYSVLNNYIGGSAINASGPNALYSSDAGSVSYQGISLTTTSATPASNIKGNTVAGISVTSFSTVVNSAPFTGIETNGAGIIIGGSATGEGNLIGSAVTNGSIIITTSTTSSANTSLIKGINCVSTGGAITGNQVAGFDINNIGIAPASSAFTGVRINTPSPPSQVNNNVIGSRDVSNSIQVLSTSGAAATSLTGISTGASVNSNILLNGNMIDNISHLSLTSSGSFTGISNGATSGIMTISNDTIKNITSAANANSNSTLYSGISSGTASFINNNIISNFALYAAGINAQVTGISVSGAFAHVITGNFIADLTTASGKTGASVETGSPAASAVIGIFNTATVAGQVISSNTLYDLNIINTSNINSVVTGIGIASNASGNIFNNRIAAFTNQANGANSGMAGITAANGSFNVYNNAVRLDNAAYANGVTMYGIIHASPNNLNCYHNTVSIAGNATGTAMRSAAFIRTVNGSLSLKNNVFINTRTGTGLNYAISNLVAPPAATWSSSASNNNDLFSNNANTTGEWGLSADKTFTAWQTASGGDANAVSRPVIFVSSLYDLQPDNLSNCALNNAGIPVTTPVVINTDLNNASRSSTSPDMGAYEFSNTVFVVSAGNNSPICAGSQLSLTSDPGVALNPTYSWTNPNNVIISTIQNPDITTLAGTYTVTITDGSGCSNTATTVVTVTPSPTATLSAPLFVCSGNSAALSLTLTGTGTISGTLSSGDIFSGTASTISVIVSPSATTSYFITTLSDANCAAKPTDRSDTARVNVRQPGDWIGSLNTNWNDSANWCGGLIPGASTNINLPGGLANYPVLNAGTAAIQNITIEAGASLAVSLATLQISGAILNNGIFNALNGSIEMNGTSSQSVAGSLFLSNSIKDLIVSNTVDVTLGGTLNITGVLTVNTGIFNVNNKNLVLKSTAAGTSRIAPVTGSIINATNVTVERFIPFGKRAYRHLSPGVNTSGNIYDNWQNSKVNTAGTGTHITGSTSASNGFDASTSGGYSLFSYTPGSAGFTAVTSTNGINDKLSALKGYRIFIRGDRNASLTVNNNTGTGTSNINMNAATTLKATGTLITGTVSYTKTGTSTTSGVDNSTTLGLNAGDYSLVGNPYWSPVDFEALSKTDIKPTYYLWDASIGNRGAYTSYTVGLGSNGGGAVNQYIQPGQAIFIQNSDAGNFGGNPSLVFNEVNKASVSTNTFRTTGQTPSKIIIALYEAGRLTNGGTMQDVSTTAFRDDFSNGVAAEDAVKFNNPDENIAIVSNNLLFGLEGRQRVSAPHDTILLRLWNLYPVNKYVLKFTASDFESGIMAFAEDKFTNQQYPLNLSGNTIIPFEFSSDSASFYNRFRIVFHPAAPLPVNITGVNAWLKNKGIQVAWQTATESNMAAYNVERSADGLHFVKAATVLATNNNNGFAAYQWFDAAPLSNLNYYRIQSMGKNNVAGYSSIVKVNFVFGVQGIKVLSNPITTNLVRFQLNNMEKGIFQMLLFNSLGQALVNQSFDYDGATGIQTMTLPKNLPAGIYQLQLQNRNLKINTTVVIQ